MDSYSQDGANSASSPLVPFHGPQWLPREKATDKEREEFLRLLQRRRGKTQKKKVKSSRGEKVVSRNHQYPNPGLEAPEAPTSGYSSTG